MAITGGSWANCWCAQIGPGGRPSIGPVPPPSAGSTGCCVVFAWAVGAGFKTETGSRGNTSKRGIGVENACTPNNGLGGSPVGMLESANALRAKGLRPLIGISRPAPVNNPILIRSRATDLSLRVCFDDIPTVFSSVLCFSQPCFRGFGRQKEVSVRHLFSFMLVQKSRGFADSGTAGRFHNATLDLDRIETDVLCSVNDAVMTSR